MREFDEEHNYINRYVFVFIDRYALCVLSTIYIHKNVCEMTDYSSWLIYINTIKEEGLKMVEE